MVLLVPPFLPPSSSLFAYLALRGTIGAKIRVEEPRGSCGDSFRNPAGVVFFLPAENGRVYGCLICGCSGLLYEILILEDIQQAYI